jgi:hypothetical protein
MSIICGLLLLMDAPRLLMGQPTSAAVFAFNSYSKAIESRLAQQHRSPNTFLALPSSGPEDIKMRLREGDFIIEKITPSGQREDPPIGDTVVRGDTISGTASGNTRRPIPALQVEQLVSKFEITEGEIRKLKELITREDPSVSSIGEIVETARAEFAKRHPELVLEHTKS